MRASRRFAEEVKAFRMSNALSQEQLARAANVPFRMIGQVEGECYIYDYLSFWKLYHYCGCQSMNRDIQGV